MHANTHSKPGDRVDDAASAPVRHLIDQWRWHLGFTDLLRRLVRIVAIAALVLFVLVVADHALPRGLPRPILGPAGWMWLAGVFLAVLAASGVAIRRRISPLFAARRAESAEHVAHNVLVNAVLVEADPSHGYARQASLRQAVAELSIAGSRPIDPASTAALRTNPPAAWMLGVVGIWLIYLGLGPKPVGPSLARLFGASIDAPTATRLLLLEPNAARPIYSGEPLKLEFAIDGSPADELEVTIESGVSDDADGKPRRDGPRRRVPRSAERGQRDVRSLELPAHEVVAPMRIVAYAGDAQLRADLPLLAVPAVIKYEIAIRPPAYMRLPDTHGEGLAVTAWAGSRASIRAIANTRAHLPTLVLRGATESRSRMNTLADEPHASRIEATLLESCEAWVEFTDEHGRQGERPPRARLAVRPDAPPRVEWTLPESPAADAPPLDCANIAQLRARVADDVAISMVQLVAERSGAQQRFACFQGDAEQPVAELAVDFDPARLEIEPGQSARVWFEARDNRHAPDGSPAPQVAASTPIVLTRPLQIAADRKGKALPRAAKAMGAKTPDGSSLVAKDRKVGDDDEPGPSGESAGQDREGDSLASSDRPGTKGTNQPTQSHSSSAAGVASEASAGTDDHADPSSVSGRKGGTDAPQDPPAGDGSVDSDASGEMNQPEADASAGSTPTGPGSTNPDGSGSSQPGQGSAPPPQRETVEQELNEFCKSHADEIEELVDHFRKQDAQEAAEPTGGEMRDDGDQPPQAEKSGQPATPPSQAADPPENSTSSDTANPPRADDTSQPQRHSQAAPPAQTGSSAPPAPQSPNEDRQDSSKSPQSDNRAGASQNQAGGGSKNAAPQQPGNNAAKSDGKAGTKAEPGTDDGKPPGRDGAGGQSPDGSEGSSGKPSAGTPSDAESDSKGRTPGAPPTGAGAANSSQSPSEGSGSPPNAPPSSPSNGSAGDTRTGGTAGGAPGQGAAPNSGGASTPPAGGDQDGQGSHSEGGDSTDRDGPQPTPGSSPGGEDRVEPRTTEADLLSILERAQQDPDSLEDAPLAPQRKRAFLKEIERLAQRAEKAGVLGPARRILARGQVGAAALSTGTRISAGATTGIRPGELPADAIQKFAAPPEQQISSELRVVLDAYYQAMARRRPATSRPSEP